MADVESGGLSLGSIFDILFFTMTSVYFFGGVCLRKFMRGAEGTEMIPHYEFWSEVPLLIRDGIMFTLNGFQPELTYERI